MVDLKGLHKFYDVDGDGSVSYTEFVNALCSAPLSERASKMVQKAWDKMGRGHSNECQGNDVSKAYIGDVNSFLECFNSTKGCNTLGHISREEFDAYYR